MLVEIPDWLASAKRIESSNCSKIYKEKLSKKLGIREYLFLDQLRIEVQKAGIKSQTEYQEKRKPNWPSNPRLHYKDEWISWCDLFGKKEKEIDICLKRLKIEVKKAKIKKRSDYKRKRKPHWPSNPNQHYKDEWISWCDLFGKKEKEIDICLKQLKIEVQKAGIKSQKEYREKRKPHWPSNPFQHYKDEWISFYNLFGKKEINISLKRLKIEVKKAKIKSQREYKQKRKSSWPSNPNNYYKDTGWQGYDHFLGK